MRVLFVHEVSYLDKVVFEMHEFPEQLIQEGANDVVFLDYLEDQTWKLIGRRRVLDRTVAGRSNSSVSIRLVSIQRLLPGSLDRLFLSLRAIWLSRSILRRIGPDVVVTYAVPTLGWQFQMACRRAKIPVVYRAIDVSHQIRDTAFSRLVRWSESRLYRMSSLVLFNNEALAEYGKSLGALSSRSVVLTPGFDPWSEEKRKIEMPTQSEYNTIFLGTLFDFCGLDWFIERLAERPASDIRLLIVGDGDLEISLKTLVNSKNLQSRVFFHGRAPYEDLPHLLSQAAVAILPFREGKVSNLALPGKVPQYLRSGIPTVSTNLSGLKSLLPEGAGVTYAPTEDAFIHQVEFLVSNKEARQNMVAAGVKILDRECQWESQIKKLINELADLISDDA